MRKMFGYLMRAGLGAALALATTLVLVNVAAADVVVTPPVSASWWNTIVEAALPTLGAVAIAILTAVGTLVGTVARAKLGETIGSIVSAGYNDAASYAAGWIKTHWENANTAALAAGLPAPPPLSANSDSVQAGVDYMRSSFPEAIAKVEKAAKRSLSDVEIASDLLGMLGNLVGGPGVMVGKLIAGVTHSRAKRA